MTGVRITAKSDVGQEVITRIMAADNGREDWQRFFNERVESDKPYQVVVEHKNGMARKMVPAAYLEAVARKQMDALGAILGVDYEVEIL